MALVFTGLCRKVIFLLGMSALKNPVPSLPSELSKLVVITAQYICCISYDMPGQRCQIFGYFFKTSWKSGFHVIFPDFCCCWQQIQAAKSKTENSVGETEPIFGGRFGPQATFLALAYMTISIIFGFLGIKRMGERTQSQ